MRCTHSYGSELQHVFQIFKIYNRELCGRSFLQPVTVTTSLARNQLHKKYVWFQLANMTMPLSELSDGSMATFGKLSMVARVKSNAAFDAIWGVTAQWGGASFQNSWHSWSLVWSLSMDFGEFIKQDHDHDYWPTLQPWQQPIPRPGFQNSWHSWSEGSSQSVISVNSQNRSLWSPFVSGS